VEGQEKRKEKSQLNGVMSEKASKPQERHKRKVPPRSGKRGCEKERHPRSKTRGLIDKGDGLGAEQEES